MKKLMVLALTSALLIPALAQAASLEELERRLDIVTQELQTLKNETAVSGDNDYSSTFGLGPAASKVYKQNRGLSVGGYGEGHFSNLVSDQKDGDDVADMLRAILYVGYKFDKNIVLNTEIEFEHTNEVSVEMAALDFLLNDAFNVRTGLLLTPVGLTNEMHEPTLFHGNDRPYVEREVIPTTWREMGLGIFGTPVEGLDYKLYVMNGLQGADFTSKGLRGGRQKGAEAKANDWAVVANLNYEPLLGLNLGGSAYLGNSGQKEVLDLSGNQADMFTEIYELHGQYKVAGLELKALGTQVRIEDNELVGAPEQIDAWYGEAAYNILPLFGSDQYLAPFYRYESVDYTGTAEDLTLYTTGISYKPIPNVVLKADYRNFDKEIGSKADEVNLGFGYIF